MIAVDLGEEAANRGDYGRSVGRVNQVETVAEAWKLDVTDFCTRYRSQSRDERTCLRHGNERVRAAMDHQERRCQCMSLVDRRGREKDLGVSGL